MRGRGLTAVSLGLLVAAACEIGTPSEPSRLKPQFVPLVVTCDVVPVWRCTASRFGDGDVTARAQWSAADSFRLAMDTVVSGSTAVEFPSPGLPRALRPAEVYIRADYVTTNGQHLRAVAPHAYAAESGGQAVPMAYVSGTSFVGPPSTGPSAVRLGGVTIEIVDGEGAGKQAMTRDDNAFYMIEFLRLGIPFTVRASKPGYEPDVRVHPGIVNGETGHPANAALHVYLLPSQ
jgi:hypothetical protein